MADQKQTKVSRKIVTSITGLTVGEPEKLSRRKFEKLVESINELIRTQDEQADQYLLDSLIVFMESPLVSSNEKSDVMKVLKSSEKLNFFSSVLEVESLIGEGRRKEAFHKILSDRRFANYARFISIVDRAATSEKDFVRAAEFLASNGVVSVELYLRAVGQAESREQVDGILKRITSGVPSSESAKVLEAMYARWNDEDLLISLVSMFLALNNTDFLRKYLGEIPVNSMRGRLLEVAIEAGKKIGDLEISLRAARREAELEPDKPGPLIDLAEVFYEQRRYADSSACYEKALSLGGDRQDIVPKLLLVKLKLNDYDGVLQMAPPVETADLEALKSRIAAEMALSRFEDAKKELMVCAQRFGEDKAYLELKLDLEMTLGDQNSAMETAEKILSLDVSNEKSMDLVISTLYSLREYDKLVERYEQASSHTESQTVFYVSASIFLGKTDEALYALEKEPSLLMKGQILDAIFLIFRTNEHISGLLGLNVSGRSREIISRLIWEIRGVHAPNLEDLTSMIRETGSVALAWALAKYTVLQGAPGTELHELLTRRQFVSVLSMVELVRSLETEKDLADLRDSEFFMFPMVERLVGLKRLKEAETVLDLTADPKSESAFVQYERALISQGGGNRIQARKHLERALRNLTNAHFLAAMFSISVDDADVAEAKLCLSSFSSIGTLSGIPGDKAIIILQERNLRSIITDSFDVIKDHESDSPWVARMVAEGYAWSGDYLNAARIIDSLCGSEDVIEWDLLRLASVSVSIGQYDHAITVLKALEPRFDTMHVERSLGQLHYLNGKKKDALRYFQRAVDKGGHPSMMPEYAEALIDLKRYDEAEKLLASMSPNLPLLARLLVSALRIDHIKEFMEAEDWKSDGFLEGFEIICEKLWANREIRETAFAIYKRTKDYRLGSIIAEKQEKSNDIRGSIDVRKALMKAYPGEIENSLALARLYDYLGRTENSIEVLKKAVKSARNQEDSKSALNTLIKTYFGNGYFTEVTSLFETMKEPLTGENAGFVIRSYMERNEFDMAEKLMGSNQGGVLNQETFDELNEEMSVRRNFFKITSYAEKLLLTEYRVRKVLDPDKAVSFAGIPIDTVDRIYAFLDEEGYYSDINEDKYEILSRDIIQKAVKKGKAAGVPDLKINVIYANLDSKDIIVAKNLYTYIRKKAKAKRSPDPNNSENSKLLRSAVRLGVKPNPLEIAYALRIGISQAMDILALMNYLYSINRPGGGT